MGHKSVKQSVACEKISMTSSPEDETKTATTGDWRRWLALIPLGFGTLIVVIDGTVMNVSLPSIRRDLGFDESSLTWVVNAYVLPYGSLLLLGGRLADIFNPRRLVLCGIAFFTVASVFCGLAETKTQLILGRALQGLGGSVLAAATPALTMTMFSALGERSRVLAILGVVSIAGSTIGVVVGGLVTSALGWHWVFLINGPMGVLLYILCVLLVPGTNTALQARRIDIWGAVTITTSLGIALYAVENGGEVILFSVRTLGLLGCSLALLAVFLIIETRVSEPLMPLHVWKKRIFTVANIICVLSSLGGSSWGYMTTLYMGGVLGYSPFRISLLFLPAGIVGAVFSLSLSAKLISALGIRWSVSGGLLLGMLGQVLFAGAIAYVATASGLLPGLILTAIGSSVAFNALSVAIIGDVRTNELGLASGVINTISLMAASIGLAVFASVARSHSSHLLASGASNGTAMGGGYQIAFVINAVCVFLAALVGAALLRTKTADGSETIAAAASPAPVVGESV
jgi:MFS family permease